jgi:predicted Zn finger-like uncharacterized protein
MRMITRCPHCRTAFRVEPAQLAARDGHVRCGRCHAVFDARAALVAAPEAAPAPADEAAATPAVAAAPPPVADPGPVETAAAQPPSPPEADRAPGAGDAPFEFGPRVRRAARLRAAWWGLASAAATLALAAQLLHAYRGEVAVLAPAARPWLEAACARLGCDVPLPRHAHLITIESSELVAERDVPDVATLAAVLRNRAVFGQALPALELTLTDGYDRPVARRVLRPRDYLGELADREPIFPANGEHAFKLHLDVAGLNASGYRLFVFHL